MIGCLASTSEVRNMMQGRIMSAGLGLLFFWAGAAHAKELAKVNGRPVTADDVTSALSSFNEGQRATLLRDHNSRRQVLLNLIEQELLFQQGEKEKLDKDPQFKRAMDGFRRQYLASRVLDKNLSGKVTDAAAKQYYERHTDRFSTDSVKVQHILVSDELAARNMLAQATAKEADFQALAEKNSRDPSAKNNRGELGWITRDSPLVDEFKDAAFLAKTGEVVGPVKSLFGYHLIKVVERKIGQPMTYDEVELRVKADLRSELMKNYVAQLRKQAKVQIDDKAVDSL